MFFPLKIAPKNSLSEMDHFHWNFVDGTRLRRIESRVALKASSWTKSSARRKRPPEGKKKTIHPSGDHNISQLRTIVSRWWFPRFVIFTPNPGEMIQIDSYFSNGLKPPTRFGSAFKPRGTTGPHAKQGATCCHG